MDRYYIYRVAICVTGGGSWRQLFIGFPTKGEVLKAVVETLDQVIGVLEDDPGQVRLLENTYGNYVQLIQEKGLCDKPGAHPNGNTTRICTYAGVTVGYIKAEVIGHAYDTQGAQDDVQRLQNHG